MSHINDQMIAEALRDPNFSFIQSFSDATDPQKVTRELTTLIFSHRRKREQLKTKEREKVVAERQYKIKKRESYQKHSKAPNEKTKGILVEIDCEKEEYDISIMEQQIKEINRDLSAIKLEIDTWKAISYSIRTEMGSF